MLLSNGVPLRPDVARYYAADPTSPSGVRLRSELLRPIRLDARANDSADDDMEELRRLALGRRAHDTRYAHGLIVHEDDQAPSESARLDLTEEDIRELQGIIAQARQELFRAGGADRSRLLATLRKASALLTGETAAVDQGEEALFPLLAGEGAQKLKSSIEGGIQAAGEGVRAAGEGVSGALSLLAPDSRPRHVGDARSYDSGLDEQAIFEAQAAASGMAVIFGARS